MPTGNMEDVYLRGDLVHLSVSDVWGALVGDAWWFLGSRWLVVPFAGAAARDFGDSAR